MKNKAIVVFLVLMVMIIIGVIIMDSLSERPERQPPNVYALPLDSLKSVDESMIIFREVRNLKLDMELPTGISLAGQNIYVVGDKKLIICDHSGKLLTEVLLDNEPLCVKANSERIYVGSAKQVTILNPEGKPLTNWDAFDDNSVLTAIDVYGGKVFIADAGKKKVSRFSEDGVKELEFEGKSGEGDSIGFLIPSAHFDLAVNVFGELWVTNPGRLTLENYTFDGKFRGWWGTRGTDIKDFTGCCNPADFTFMPDGNFVTSEKGIVRIKEYNRGGDLVGVVAPPSKFEGEIESPDIVTDDGGRVYALDKERSMIRVFEKK